VNCTDKKPFPEIFSVNCTDKKPFPEISSGRTYGKNIKETSVAAHNDWLKYQGGCKYAIY